MQAPAGRRKRPSIKVESADFILTLNQERTIIREGTVLVADDRIVAIDKAEALKETVADRVIDARGMVATPGLCNGHLHVSYAHAVRGALPDQLRREEYVKAVFQMQASMTEEEERLTTLLAVTELLKYGTTCFLDPGSTRFLDAALEVYDQAGCRVVVGSHVVDRPAGIELPTRTTSAAIRHMEQTIETYDQALDGRIHAWAMPFSARLCSPALLQAAAELASEKNTGWTIHQNFSPSAVEEFVLRHSMRPVEALEDWGLLGPQLLLAHATGIDHSEVAAISRSRTSVVVCPAAAMKLGLGFSSSCPLPELLASNVTIGLGTDAANSSNLIDTTRALYLVAVAFKDARQDTSLVPAEKAVEMATIDGATALGLASETGSLEAGKKADLVLFDARNCEWRSLFNPVNNLVYSADGRSVHTVIVDGRVVVENGTPLFVDEERLGHQVQTIGTRILKRNGFRAASSWPIV